MQGFGKTSIATPPTSTISMLVIHCYELASRGLRSKETKNSGTSKLVASVTWIFHQGGPLCSEIE